MAARGNKQIVEVMLITKSALKQWTVLYVQQLQSAQTVNQCELCCRWRTL